MTNKILIPLLSVLLLLVMACQPQENKESDRTDFNQFVNPFVGTGGHGHTFPGATLPYGMVQLSPDNGTEGWDWCSGYHYSDSVIVGFSHLHLSGTGIGDLCDISFMPGIVDKNYPEMIGSFSHQNESATPGYYSVQLENYNIKTELTTTPRVGYQQHTFPATDSAVVKLDLGFMINWDAPTETSLQVINDSTIQGYRKSTGWAKDQWVYFYSVFSAPFEGFRLYQDSSEVAETEVNGKLTQGHFYWNVKESTKIGIKTGISMVGTEGAKKAIDQELPGWNFKQTKETAADIWNQQLAKLDVHFDEADDQETFYSALYHTMMAPTLFSDANGEYKGVDSTVQQSAGYDRYTVFSIWDTFRAAHPLFTLTQPDLINDFINSMLAFYDEYGLLPVWALEGNETNTMTGYHAVPVIVEAYLKGFQEYDVKKAYEAIKASAAQDIRGTDLYREYHYIPADLDGWSVTKTLEYAYDDWCIAQMAKALGEEEDYQYFTQRSQYYQNLFDPESGFMRGKNSDGTWVEPFDPYYSEHGFEGIYIEGTAWQHSWFVPHDVQGLIGLFGSEMAFTKQLDQLFSAESIVKGENASADISGMIGQYAHGNEPSHHIAYFYNYAGQPWKTQALVRQIIDSLYTNQPDGYSGNEDCGQMSAWYVFSSLGFYPVNPASGVYVIGSPKVEEATLNLNGNVQFKIMAENNSPENIYIQSATLNGAELTRSYITHQELMAGGELIFIMGNQPNKELWSDKRSYPLQEM